MKNNLKLLTLTVLTYLTLTSPLNATVKPIEIEENFELNTEMLLHKNTIIAQNNDARKAQADRLLQQGIQQYNISQFREAAQSWQQALDLYQEINDRSGIAKNLLNLGNVYDSLGEYEKAIDYFQRSLSITEEIGDRFSVSKALNNLGIVYNSLGEYGKAIDYYQRSLTIYQEINDPKGISYALNNLGIVYDSLGEYEKAIDYYQRSLAITEEIGDPKGISYALNNLGEVYRNLGEYEKAIDYYQRSLAITEEIGDPKGISLAVNNLGIVYRNLGEYEKAIDYYQSSLAITEEIGDPQVTSYALNNLGLVYENLGEYEKAIDYYQSSLAITEEIGDPKVTSYALNNLGNVYYSWEEYEKAIDYYQRSLAITEEIGDPEGISYALNNLGEVYDSLGEDEKAIDYYQSSLAITEEIGEQTTEATILKNIAVLERSRGNLEIALTKIEFAINLIEELRSKYISPELRQTYFASVQDYQFYLDLLMELHQQNPDQGYDKQAFNVSEKSRARVLLELLTEANANIKEGVDPALLAQEKDLQNQLDTTEKLRLAIYNNNGTDEQKTNINQRQEELIEDYKQLQDEIRKNSPNYAALKYPQPLTLEEVQAHILDEDTLLLQYALGEDQSYLFAVSKEGFQSYELPAKIDIDQAVNELRQLLTNYRRPPESLQETQLRFSNLILAPVAEQLPQKKRLLIVADGSLHNIPFSALAIPNQTNFIPLIQDHEIVNLPSASTLEIIRNEKQNRPTASNLIAMLADPVFTIEDERLDPEIKQELRQQVITEGLDLNNPLALSQRNRGDNTEIDLNLSALERSSKSFTDWIPLPATETEANNILQLTPDPQEITAFGFDANREFIYDEKMRNYQYIHLATHGFLNTENPELSGIVLSLLDRQGNAQNGFLRLGDIFNLKFNAKLVVLSACETALGKEAKGEGMIGLSRGLMYAGAQRLVLSLWNVNDQATAEFMTRFYKLILENNLTPAQALRETQLQMQTETEWKHPYYWAAFVLQGEYN
jgi:CHAT domain-containing protein/tetratricopeptide (TPR) repeat protein